MQTTDSVLILDGRDIEQELGDVHTGHKLTFAALPANEGEQPPGWLLVPHRDGMTSIESPKRRPFTVEMRFMRSNVNDSTKGWWQPCIVEEPQIVSTIVDPSDSSRNYEVREVGQVIVCYTADGLLHVRPDFGLEGRIYWALGASSYTKGQLRMDDAGNVLVADYHACANIKRIDGDIGVHSVFVTDPSQVALAEGERWMSITEFLHFQPADARSAGIALLGAAVRDKVFRRLLVDALNAMNS